jgi:hypothetical protein
MNHSNLFYSHTQVPLSAAPSYERSRDLFPLSLQFGIRFQFFRDSSYFQHELH